MAENLEGCPAPTTPADVVRQELRTALKEAMRNRDRVATAALRSVLAAIDNAEAPDAARAPNPTEDHATLAGTVAGVGAGEVERQILSEAEVEHIIEAEILERDRAAQTYHLSGRDDRAEGLKAEADVLRAHLTRPTPPA